MAHCSVGALCSECMRERKKERGGRRGRKGEKENGVFFSPRLHIGLERGGKKLQGDDPSWVSGRKKRKNCHRPWGKGKKKKGGVSSLLRGRGRSLPYHPTRIGGGKKKEKKERRGGKDY